MRPLRLPKTIRTPRPDEVPKDPEIVANIEARNTANIVEGYKVIPNPEGPFSFYAEINVDSDRLWELFTRLMLQLPEVVALVFGPRDEEPQRGENMDKYELLNILKPWELELTNDGFLEFGVIYNDEETLEEVFIAAPKFIKYWGTDKERFVHAMHEFSLFEIMDLAFIDEYPMITEGTLAYFPEARDTSVVLEALELAVCQ